MATIVSRVSKGAALSFEEYDANNSNLNAALVAAQAAIAAAPKCIAQSYAPVTRSSDNLTDTTYTTLATVTVPGGLMNANGKIVIEQDWKHTNSVTVKNLRVDWGGNWITGPSVTTVVNSFFMLAVKNANSLGSQIMLNGIGYGSSALDTTSSVDTTANVAIDFKCNWAANVAGEQIILRGYSVWYYPGT